MQPTRSNFIIGFLFIFLIMLPVKVANAQELTAAQQETIHKELRTVRETVLEAMKNRDPDALLAVFAEDVTFTAMNNEVVYGLDGARAYYDKMIKGSASIVEDMSFDLESDNLSRLYNNGMASVSAGTSNTYFKIRGGLEFSVPLRWTATMSKESGTWKINAVHFSANIFDNPVSGGFLKYFWWILAGVTIVAGILGYLFGKRSRVV